MNRAALPVTLLLGLAGCHASAASPDAGIGADAPCTVLFGRPGANTGLTADQCQPSCTCGGKSFTPPSYSDAFIQSLVTDWQLVDPPAPLASDPYADAAAPPDDPPGTVCAVLRQSGGPPTPYTLVTYPSEGAAAAAGAKVTHFGHCGLCSSLANLSVYMRVNDLTDAVRSCGLQKSADGGDADFACLEQLGFDLPCAQIWAYNTANTRAQCLAPCLSDLSQPYNLPDGALNDCLQCDEDRSGPVFKAVAGRTRRNCGLPNAMCRPCSAVEPLVHSY
jgi:hypothetical protein